MSTTITKKQCGTQSPHYRIYSSHAARLAANLDPNRAGGGRGQPCRAESGGGKRRFVGMEGHAAKFNFKFGDTGYQGDALGGGIAGGNPRPFTLTSDLSDALAAFNTDRKTPLTLTSGITVTITPLGVTAEISDWEGGATKR